MKEALNLLVVRIWHELQREEAQDLIEYALLAGLLALAAISALKSAGGLIDTVYVGFNNALAPYLH